MTSAEQLFSKSTNPKTKNAWQEFYYHNRTHYLSFINSKIAGTMLIMIVFIPQLMYNQNSRVAATHWVNMLMGKIISTQKAARENSIEGMVVVQFIIHEDGTPGDFEVVEGIGYGCVTRVP